MPRTGQKVTVGGGGWVVGGGVESKFSVQLRPKLNNYYSNAVLFIFLFGINQILRVEHKQGPPTPYL